MGYPGGAKGSEGVRAPRRHEKEVSMRRLGVLVFGLVLLGWAIPALADDVVVTVEGPSFVWNKKTAGNSNYDWKASINNPSRRKQKIDVRLELLEGSNVVATSPMSIVALKKSVTPVGLPGTIPFTTAKNVTHYRIVVEKAAKKK